MIFFSFLKLFCFFLCYFR